MMAFKIDSTGLKRGLSIFTMIWGLVHDAVGAPYMRFVASLQGTGGLPRLQISGSEKSCGQIIGHISKDATI